MGDIQDIIGLGEFKLGNLGGRIKISDFIGLIIILHLAIIKIEAKVAWATFNHISLDAGILKGDELNGQIGVFSQVN